MTYTIKPLVWESRGGVRESWHAETTYGEIRVWESLDRQRFIVTFYFGDWPRMNVNSIEDGKAKAEAHYCERLMQALEPVTARGGAGVLVNEREG